MKDKSSKRAKGSANNESESSSESTQPAITLGELTAIIDKIVREYHDAFKGRSGFHQCHRDRRPWARTGRARGERGVGR